MTAPKRKLIEVAIPIDIINNASIREKSIRHGHPSTFHVWWARRPLATCRAVLFCQLVDDPSSFPDKFPTEEAITLERARLFSIVERLVKWENSNSKSVLDEAKTEIRKCFDGALPTIYDPFSGGSSIPLEAHRLGLDARGSDLNPVSVLIGKALLELPQEFKGKNPVHPGIKQKTHYENMDGLAEDIRYFARVLLDRTCESIGHLYPKVQLESIDGKERATVLSWIWVRTVESPDPAMKGTMVPLVASYWLCKKPKKKVWVEPYISDKEVRFFVKSGTPSDEKEIECGNKVSRGANFVCQLSGTAITAEYVKDQGIKGKMGWKLLAIVAESKNGRKYISPKYEHENIAFSESPSWEPDFAMSRHSQYMSVTNYGITRWSKYFMSRPKMVLTELLSNIPEVCKDVTKDKKYRKLIETYLTLGVSRLAGFQAMGAHWGKKVESVIPVFSMQALPMRWDTTESNPFSNSSGNFLGQIEFMVKVILKLPDSKRNIQIDQNNATEVDFSSYVVSTDPPYYDNIPYADLSDFYYVWLRKGLKSVYPSLFETILVPKSEELVADRERHFGKEKAEKFFLNGMTTVISNIAKQGNSLIPTTLYYAYRQGEVSEVGKSSRGWSTFLQAIVDSGFQINATWPIRTEFLVGKKQNKNALSTSIILVCRPRSIDAGSITRSEFIEEIRREIRIGLKQLRDANISPTDLPQSSIGPGIGVYTKYNCVLEANDAKMDVKTALQLINKELDDILNDLHGNFDSITRFLISWYEHMGLKGGEFGKADSIARARGTSVDNIKSAGLVESSMGIVRILNRSELTEELLTNSKLLDTVWGGCQGVMRVLEQSGELKAGALLSSLPSTQKENIKDLAYCLYDISVNKVNNAEEANSYNGLISVWSELLQHASSYRDENEIQGFFDLRSNHNG